MNLLALCMSMCALKGYIIMVFHSRSLMKRRDRLPIDNISASSVDSFKFQLFDVKYFVSNGASFFISDLVHQKANRSLGHARFSFFKKLRKISALGFTPPHYPRRL